jgi:hypothetical protein
MCPLLAQLIIGLFSSFFAAAVYNTNEENTDENTNEENVKQSVFLDV